MAAVTPNTNQARAMRVAMKRIEGFAKQFGEAHRNLARHAAFPFVLTPDLLYQIWANFVPDAPWTAVAHVLLSRLCRQVGYEMYEMDITDRNLLLRELKEQFGQERLDELGKFLLDYVAQRLTEDDADTQDLREAQEWTALAYTQPTEAARELAEALSLRVKQEDMTEVFRLALLVETFAEPLVQSGFEPLLIYADGMTTFVRGNQEGAAARFAKLPVQRGQVEIAGVSLDIPLDEPTIPASVRNDNQTSEPETGDNELRIEEASEVKNAAVFSQTENSLLQSIFPACPQLREVFDFIEANYHQPITLKDVAKAAGYSSAYLTDLVRRQTGKTVNLWIIERRMTEACSLLRETDQSVDGIAETVGYLTTAHFFRQFRQYHGTTPQAWRNAQRNRSQVIENWESHDEPEHLRAIRDRLLRSGQRSSQMLLLYKQILEQGEVVADGSPEQTELLLSGLVVRQDGKLRVFKRIYEAVFNLAWVEQAIDENRYKLNNA